MIKRIISEKLLKSKKSVLLIGPRQTGKSTLIKSLKPDLLINLANEREYLRFSSDPDLLESMLRGAKHRTVFIDEIQRIPSLLNTVQDILDNWTKAPKFYLSGSSARKLRRGQANLLPGRLFIYTLGGFCGAELNLKLDIKKALKIGLLPEPYLFHDIENSEKLLDSYAGTYLKEEIQAEALTKNIQGFSRFLNICASQAGLILDFSKLSTKAKVSRTSTIRFVELLEDTLIAQRVEVFQEAKSADTIKHPKLYFFDVGVLNGVLGNYEASADRVGILFEHFIYSQILNSARAYDKKIEIQYFRTRNNVEVDFIIKMNGKVWAIEVKTGDVNKQDLTSLEHFKEYYPKTHQCIAVSLKESHVRKINGILICGWAELLKELGFN